MKFRCGACGTEADLVGMWAGSWLTSFQREHAQVCPGFPPTSAVEESKPTKKENGDKE